jgi:MATE family multidrug resistance protein
METGSMSSSRINRPEIEGGKEIEANVRPAIPPSQRGGIREVMILGLPVALTQMSITAMQTVDSVMVGTLGATELGAVGFGGIWLWTFMCFFVGVTNAIQTFVSQHYGAGEYRECGYWSWQGLYATVPLAAVASLALFFGAEPLMDWLRPSESMKPLVVDYVSVRALGGVGLCIAVALASFFRGLGDTRTPLYATLIANGVNVVLDYGLIFGELGLPELGVQGAGIATSVAEWVYMGVMGVWFLRASPRARFATHPVRPARAAVRRVLRTGMPIGGQWCLEMLSFAAFSTGVARLGDASMAASQAFIILLSLSFMQAIGISMAVSTMVGQYIGAKELEHAERSFRSGMVLVAGLSAAVALLFAFASRSLMSMFTDDPEVIRMGVSLLRVGAAFQLFDAVAIVADGALRGAGDTRWPFLARFALSWGVFLPLAWGFGFYLEGGLTWAWVGGLIYIAILSGSLIWRFRSGAWREIEI